MFPDSDIATDVVVNRKKVQLIVDKDKVSAYATEKE